LVLVVGGRGEEAAHVELQLPAHGGGRHLEQETGLVTTHHRTSTDRANQVNPTIRTLFKNIIIPMIVREGGYN
jgi:hypothetical protein